MFSAPKDQTCTRCIKRPATQWWVGDGGILGAVHGMITPYCDRCCIEEQLISAREQAARIPELEAKLASLR